jgi:putative protease
MTAAGVDSIKLEGRAKSHYYVAVVTNAYRGALDSLSQDPLNWQCPAWVTEELNKMSHRTYSTGFYFGTPENAQTYENAGYIRDYAIAAIVDGYEDGFVLATLKNKFLRGQRLDCLEAGSVPFAVPTDILLDGKGEAIDMANRPMMRIKIPFDREIKVGSMLRMKVED